MSTELLPCPFCNGKAKTSDAGFGPVNQDEVLSLHFVECVDCGLMVAADTLDEAIRLWNRRFVCLDKNGDKVFAGDEVKYRIWDEQPTQHFRKCRIMELEEPYHGYGLVGDNDFWTTMFSPHQIELIKEAE